MCGKNCSRVRNNVNSVRFSVDKNIGTWDTFCALQSITLKIWDSQTPDEIVLEELRMKKDRKVDDETPTTNFVLSEHKRRVAGNTDDVNETKNLVRQKGTQGTQCGNRYIAT